MSYQRSYPKHIISQFIIQKQSSQKTEYDQLRRPSKTPIKSYQQVVKQCRYNNPTKRQCQHRLNNINSINDHISSLLAVVNKRDRHDDRYKNDGVAEICYTGADHGFNDYKRRLNNLEVLQDIYQKSMFGDEELLNKMRIFPQKQQKAQKRYRKQINYLQDRPSFNNIDDKIPVSRPSQYKGRNKLVNIPVRDYRSRSPVIATNHQVSKYCRLQKPTSHSKQKQTYSTLTSMPLTRDSKPTEHKRTLQYRRRTSSSSQTKENKHVQDTIFNKLKFEQFNSNHISEESKQISNFQSDQNDKNAKNKIVKLFSFDEKHKLQDTFHPRRQGSNQNQQQKQKQRFSRQYQNVTNPRYTYTQQNQQQRVYEHKLKQMEEGQNLVHVQVSQSHPSNKSTPKNLLKDFQITSLNTNFELKLIPCSLNTKNIKPYIADKFAQIVAIDVQFAGLKEMFFEYNSSRFSIRYKKQQLVKVLQSRGVFIQIHNLQNLISFQNISESTSGSPSKIQSFSQFLQTFVDKFLQSQYEFQKKIIHMLTINEIKQTLFLAAHLDLQNRGYLKVEDLACFINLHGTGSYCFRNRDVKDLFSKFIRIQINMVQEDPRKTQTQKNKQIQQLRSTDKLTYQAFIKVISDKL